MLAVQRPMSKLPHHMLFGYSVDSSNSLYRLPSPPPLAPGPSLLDDTDTRFLDSFFDGVSSDQYLLNDPNDAWNYDWQDLPPDFLGTTSSFGPQVEPVTNDIQHLTFPEFRNSLGFLPEQLSPSEDVMSAASALRNGNNNHQNNNQNNNQNTHINGHHSNAFMALASRTQHTSPPFNNHGLIKPEQPAPQQRKMSNRPEDYIRHASMSEAMYAPNPTSYAPHPSNKKKVEIKWGSDSGFNTGRRFVAPPNTITLDEIDESIISTLECLQPGSNVSTRASSPRGGKMPQGGDRRLEMISEGARDDDEERPKKRKKNKGKEGVYESDALEQPQSTPNTKLPRKRRPKSFGTPGSDTPNRAPPPVHKRLKPTTGMSLSTPKMARENLTEDQKRENHIKSEQKRRTLIKEGFEDLNELVPELRGGGFSKSAVLIMAADWLEELVGKNEGLRGMVAELEARGGM
ncbi:hypothetical protein VC83_03711 [Pseudogymnoascus destructans]|uniref:BHLH domain-containing protein n=2 Tax=Pseudogymnoascus destructans TaxID=655981 RepID=L8G472_PSED2|nr:uncharacterized protein VC83_03711 [Pseudogymnoascus destructans]ELR07579.1 hypothetical protein GMDG_02627 [Pseudogymnoascus destructans 20631-21]OAF59442.1 hypothetical protein VC83_03711 [Pseudogymnoascus destructans]